MGFILLKALEFFVFRKMEMPETQALPGGRAAGAGSGASAAAEPHPGAPDGAQRRGL